MTETPPRKDDRSVLLAAALLAMVLGSVHAFSVFLDPLEQQLGASRASVSLTYSFALLCLTAAVLWGHSLYAKTTAARFVLGTSILAALGAIIAAGGGNLTTIWIGYSLIFGAANGLGYGFGLQIAAQANPSRPGLAMGIVTAAYALGAVAAPPIFATACSAYGFSGAMLILAAILVITGLNCAMLMSRAKARFVAPLLRTQSNAAARLIAHYWLAYGCAVFAGLMAIGHAAGIATALDANTASWIAPATLAICNLTGALIGGRLSDFVSPKTLLTALPLLSAVGLASAALVPSIYLLALGAIGFAYGAIIAIYPAVIAKRFGENGPRLYGRVFTAWGFAGLAGPWLAGALFDATGGYRIALLIAAALAAISSLAAFRLPNR